MSAVLDPRDRAIVAATPILPVPAFGELPQLAVGAKRFLAARDGLWIEARTPALHVRLRVSEAVLPYGATSALLHPTAGPVSRELLLQAMDRAEQGSPAEIACAVVLDGAGHRLVDVPILSAGPGHVSYTDSLDDDLLVMDIHSHGIGPAYFSTVDDASDQSRRGPYLSLVLGRCSDGVDGMEVAARLSISPYLIPLSPQDLRLHGVLA